MTRPLTWALCLSLVGEAAADVTVAINEPSAATNSGDVLQISVTVQTGFMTTAVATVDSRTITLAPQSSGTFNTEYRGALALAGLSEGTKTISVTATEQAPGTAVRTVMGTFTYDSEPDLVVSSPKMHSVGRPTIRLTLTCTDSGQPCPTILVQRRRDGDTAPKTTVLSLSNTAAYDQDVSFAAIDPTDTRLFITALDSANKVTEIQRLIYIDSGPLLVPIMSVNGRILDASRDRALYITEDGDTRILHRDQCNYSSIPDHPSEFAYGRLTPTGGIAWNGSPDTVRVAGDYVVRHDGLPPTTWTRIHLPTNTKTAIPATGITNADIGPNGTVAYRTSEGTFTYDLQGTTTTVRSGATGNLRTDGTIVVGTLQPAVGDCTVFAWSGGVYEALVDWPTCILDRHFQVANGRVAFVRPAVPSSQAVLRERDGTRTTIAPAKWIDILTSTGATLLHVDDRVGQRHRPTINQTTTLVNTLGFSVADDDIPLVIIGRTVFGVGAVPPCSTPNCTADCDGGTLRPPDPEPVMPDGPADAGVGGDASAPIPGGGGGCTLSTGADPRPCGFALAVLLLVTRRRRLLRSTRK